MNLNILRPSTLARVVEDTIIGTAKGIGRGALHAGRFTKHLARDVKHDVAIEMQARTLARYQRSIRKASARLDSMTPAERVQLNKDMQAVQDRATQLSASRR